MIIICATVVCRTLDIPNFYDVSEYTLILHEHNIEHNRSKI